VSFNACVSPAQRTTVKRTCIKSLPSVLCIHLMRFGFDWESGRSIKYDEQIRVRRVFFFFHIGPLKIHLLVLLERYKYLNGNLNVFCIKFWSFLTNSSPGC